MAAGKAFMRGRTQVKEFTFTLPILLDRGVWRPGGYAKGDVVTWGGSMFIAQRDTATKPETAESDWRLAVKRGRDGKEGPAGDRGLQGVKGDVGERGPPGYRG